MRTAATDKHPAIQWRVPANKVNLIGRRFQRLLVIGAAPNRYGDKQYKAMWLCLCDCGNKIIKMGDSLKVSQTNSCGCLKIKTVKHGLTIQPNGERHPLYAIWKSMRYRCEYPKHKSYPDYGGRGISVCERWQHFENFVNDMGEKPSAKHSLDRIENDGNYEPGNCRWGTVEQQSNNKRVNRFLLFKGERNTISQWSRITGFNKTLIRNRIANGWSIEDALTVIPKRGNKIKLK